MVTFLFFFSFFFFVSVSHGGGEPHENLEAVQCDVEGSEVSLLSVYF